ncbi:zinc finger and BTB domain-containing protein 7B-like isoform X1 [Harmonia axyridis]|uniref:zinc finger and BTB domain-containing protein 7B-like isoform X1 n=1 Tax=Harmonia axyridis TaxID=115357 RepID=UPI001E275C05|nr:zinc finger and BTB domain-containing protein 7B-like isoform X1 [Harmonia axyridis]XP_045473791.1 zinc finger and BTB domain-containing protein 7B-like isoform X1 [Harmonia axyridis]
MAVIEDQQFCLRWNNFQANFTSQFETLRDDEDFTDVTIACEGQKLQAHKVVLSACSPYFKELFKTNPCSHPIIFMKDVEAQHIVALMEFMYAGEVNVAQANLSAFLKTAESLKIRGLTDTSTSYDNEPPKEEDTLYLNPQSSKHSISRQKSSKPHISSSSTVTSSQDVPKEMSPSPSPPPKRQCKSVSDVSRPRPVKEEVISGVNPFAIQTEVRSQLEIISKSPLEPKIELPDYSSDDETREDISNYYGGSELTELPGGTEIIPQNLKGATPELTLQNLLRFRRRPPESWLDFAESELCSSWKKEEKSNRLIKLGDGIEIYEDQLRSVKWNDYRKLTRGLATILFSPAELATCSVTGQRWSRAGSVERPVKPALDRTKVQAIISYVATRFPMIEVSRIKQVLAYKCKENSTALRMKAVRYYGNQVPK